MQLRRHHIYAILVLEAVAICCIVGFLLMRTTSVRDVSTVSITPVKKTNIAHVASSTLKNFFELQAGAVHDPAPKWLGDYNLVNTINNDTLNERFDYSALATPGMYRIIVLGDSWTFGQFTSTPDNYTELLEDLLNTSVVCPSFNHFEVINMGVMNYDIAFESERFRIRGLKYHPDAVIWFIHRNDLNEITDYLMDTEESEYEKLKKVASSSDFGTYDEVNGYKGILVGDGGEILRVEAIVRAYDKMRATFSEDEILNYQYGYFEAFRKMYTGPTLLYVSDGLFQYTDGMWNMLEKFASSYTGIDLYKTPLSFDRNGPELNPDFHPSLLGHKRIATDMFEHLLQSELSECSLR